MAEMWESEGKFQLAAKNYKESVDLYQTENENTSTVN